MSDQYAATGAQPTTASSPGDSSLGIEGDATVRGKIYDAVVGHGGAPADNVIAWLVRRATALGTPDAVVTGQPLDDAAPTALISPGEDYSVEPTMAAGSELLDFPLNQRATFRWVVAPNGEIWVSASATDAIIFTPIATAYILSAEATAHWTE